MTGFTYAAAVCSVIQYYRAVPSGQTAQFTGSEWAMLGGDFSLLRILACRIVSDVALRLLA
jgi:hypothetical protein